MKKLLLCFILVISITGCMEQSQEQKINYQVTERGNFNTVPWESIDLIPGIGESKINSMKNEFDKGPFLSGKDFEKRMRGKLSPEIIGKIGDKYDFEVVE